MARVLRPAALPWTSWRFSQWNDNADNGLADHCLPQHLDGPADAPNPHRVGLPREVASNFLGARLERALDGPSANGVQTEVFLGRNRACLHQRSGWNFNRGRLLR